MEDIDLVFHEAALVSVEESVSDPIRSNEINASGTLTILEAAEPVRKTSPETQSRS